MRLILSGEAEADLRGIIHYSITQWGRERARRYVGGLRDKLDLLAEHPEIGPPADEVRPGLRRLTYYRHSVFYRIRGPETRIVRILHKQMEAERHFP